MKVFTRSCKYHSAFCAFRPVKERPDTIKTLAAIRYHQMDVVRKIIDDAGKGWKRIYSTFPQVPGKSNSYWAYQLTKPISGIFVYLAYPH
jgi:hypothetical protein